MGLTTQRLLVIIIALNLFTQVGIEIYNGNSLNFDRFETDRQLNEEIAQTQFESSTSFQTNTEIGNTIGNTLKMGWNVLSIFAKGLIPYPFNIGDFDTQIEQGVAAVLIMFKSIALALISLEVYMLIKNKKTS